MKDKMKKTNPLGGSDIREETMRKVSNIIFKCLNYFEKNKALIIGLICTVMVAFIYCMTTYNKSFTLNEGWHSVFAKNINDGKLPYRDFELLLNPLYIYIIAIFTKIFGYDIIVLRIVGVILFLLISGVVYLIFVNIFKPWIANISALVTVFFMQSEITYSLYDYSRFYDFFTLITTYCLIVYLRKLKFNNNNSLNYIRLCGFLSSLAFLIRQSSGAIVWAFIILAVIFAGNMLKTKSIVAHTINFVIFSAIPIAINFMFLIVTGSFTAYMEQTVTAGLSGKGGFFTVLFAWIPNSFEAIYLNFGKVMLILVILATVYFLALKFKTYNSTQKSKSGIIVIFSLSMVCLIIICLKLINVSNYFVKFRYMFTPDVIYFVIFILFFIFLEVIIIAAKENLKISEFNLLFLIFCGVILAIGYGCGTSGGLAEGQLGCGLGLIVAIILKYSDFKFGKFAKGFVISVCMVLCCSFISFKYINTYNWWGLAQSDIRNATYSVDNSLLKGIKVSLETKNIIEGITNDITSNTQKEDNIFIWPHTPIFYLLSDRYSDTFTFVQWFDFSSNKGIMNDFEKIKHDPPKVLLICEVPEFATLAHEAGFRGGATSYQRVIQNGLLQLASEKYTLLNTYDNTGYIFRTFVLNS